MSFSLEVKKEICENLPRGGCCRHALFLGMIVIRSSIQKNEIVFPCENAAARTLAKQLLYEQVRRGSVSDLRTEEGKGLPFVFESRSLSQKLQEFSAQPYSSALVRKCGGCEGAFLRGIFISAGRVSRPEREYRLEISCGDKIDKVQEFLEYCGFEPKRTRRRNEELLYFRDSTSIEDFFATLGATRAVFDMMNSKIERDIRNNANRVSNCETKNIDRAVAASVLQIETITKLRDSNKLSFLPPELARTAELRLANSEMNLTQLGAIMEPPISKSGMSHRLSKIMEIAGQLLKEDKQDSTNN